MFYANDQNGNRVGIDQTIAKEPYFCPVCKERLVLKKGNKRIHHFSHKSSSICTDHWHYEMSEWHKKWQERFPEECREVVRTYDGKSHRADVLLEDKKCVIEFQHSKIGIDEYRERNAFYKALGYRVIWVFDVIKEVEQERIHLHRDRIQREKGTLVFGYRRDPFNDIEMEDKVTIYFQWNLPAKENKRVQDAKEILAEFGEYYDEDGYYETHKNDEGLLRQLVWIAQSDNGNMYFITNKYRTACAEKPETL